MAKRPELKTVEDGYFQKDIFNYNFEAIATHFGTLLSREPLLPNYMTANLDVSDAHITNVRELRVTSMTVANEAFDGFGGERWVEKLAALDCGEGAIITHNADGDPICRAPGTNGQVLKTIGPTVGWAEDIDTDTDTIGVTVQEDGVTVAENVTEINFITGTADVVTTPATNQVDLDLIEVLGPLWESNLLDPDTNAGLFINPAEVLRLDLLSVLDELPSTAGEYYVVVEGSNWFVDTPLGGSDPSDGTWAMDTRFYDDTGTSTPLTGNEITLGTEEGEDDTTPGGVLITLFHPVPANARYVDFAWVTLPTVPIVLGEAYFTDRYRALIRGSQVGTFASPQGHTTQGVRTSTSAP